MLLVSDKELFLFGSSLTLISDGLRSGNPSDRPGKSFSNLDLTNLDLTNLNYLETLILALQFFLKQR